jgi:hypothetical protein
MDGLIENETLRYLAAAAAAAATTTTTTTKTTIIQTSSFFLSVMPYEFLDNIYLNTIIHEVRPNIF